VSNANRKRRAVAQFSGYRGSRVRGGTAEKQSPLPCPMASAISERSLCPPFLRGPWGRFQRRPPLSLSWDGVVHPLGRSLAAKPPLPNTANAEQQGVARRAECSELKPVKLVFGPAMAADSSFKSCTMPGKPGPGC